MEFKVIKLSLPLQRKPQLPKIIFSQDKKQPNSQSTLRFLKNKNIIEFNKQNIEFNYHSSTHKLENDTSSRTSQRNSIINFPRSIKTQRSTLRTAERFTIFPTDKRQNIFSPQMKSEIVKRHQNNRKTHDVNRTVIDTKVNNICYEDKLGLQKLLKKNNISGARCLMGKNIPKIQERYAFSRFQLFNLYTYYKTLLQASKQSVKQLRKGFESIMYINKIQLNSDMIERMFVEFFKEISFENFMKVYGNIQNLLFSQNIVEYMITVFSQFYKEEYLSGEKVFQTLRDKLGEAEAIEIRKMLYQFYCRRESEDMVQVQQILNACSQNPAICKRIFNGMKKQSTNKDSGKESGDKK